jgi:hypothetical protein
LKFVLHVGEPCLVQFVFAGHVVQGALPELENVCPSTQGTGSHVFVVALYVKLALHVGVPDTGHDAKFVGHGSQGIFPVDEKLFAGQGLGLQNVVVPDPNLVKF